MNLNKELIQANVNLIRNLPYDKRALFEKQAFKNFATFLNNIEKTKILVFVLNSPDEINIMKWIEYAINKKFQTYIIHHMNYSKWRYLKVQNLKFETEWFKNRYQPRLNKKDLTKKLSFDYLFVPITLFNHKKQFQDNETNVINRLISSERISKKIGYCFSIQCLNASKINEKNIGNLDAIITNAYIIE